MYNVFVIKEGYNRPESQGTFRSGGSVTLLKGLSNIIVDTGSAWDKDIILKGLASHNLTPDDIQYMVCSHGHSDHVGNLNLFTQALQIVGYDICREDQYLEHDFKENIPYKIDEHIEVWATPGHTGTDVSVVVKNTKFGTVVVAGDLFESESDLDCPSQWQEFSEHPEIQEKGRSKILSIADYIVPGHGAMFKVPKKYKKSATYDGES